jgi:hypothetical protein
MRHDFDKQKDTVPMKHLGQLQSQNVLNSNGPLTYNYRIMQQREHICAVSQLLLVYAQEHNLISTLTDADDGPWS